MKPDKRVSAFSVFKKKRKISEESTRMDVIRTNKKKTFKKKKAGSENESNSFVCVRSACEQSRCFKGSHNHIQEQKLSSATDFPFMFDSMVEGHRCFEWLIHPVKPDKFFSELWEKKPLLVKRHQPVYYKAIFSSNDLDRILKEELVNLLYLQITGLIRCGKMIHLMLHGISLHFFSPRDIQLSSMPKGCFKHLFINTFPRKILHYTQNIDITTYKEGKRETHNPIGRAYASSVWHYYQSGCSVRVLNPQTYSRSVWKLNSILQEYFGSFVGANVYLTPPGSQGFAPHYDDIEAFVLQLEGRKVWKLYNPRQNNEELPRHSSGNFIQEEIGEPMLTVELKPGDLLYFPRGIIHQANTPESIHSLHITLSTCQRNTWGDLLEKMVPRALQLAFEEDIEFRQVLPRTYMQYTGVANSDVETPERDFFLKKICHLMTKLVHYLPVDAAVDQMAKNYIHDCLPPLFTEGEKACSIHGNGETWHNGQVQNITKLQPVTEVKLIRQNVLRLVMEENSVHLYHTLENSRMYREYEPKSIEIGAELAPAIEFLLHMYPRYAAIEQLPLDALENKMDVACLLYDNGLLLTKEPLCRQ